MIGLGEVIEPKTLPVGNPAFRGELTRVVISTPRRAGKPLPAYELALHVMAGRGSNSADRPLLRVMAKWVGTCLRNYRDKRIVRSIEGPGRSVLWEIAL